MISPRRSDQLFDLADILPTALDLAGVPREKLAELFPRTTYIDGVDQASFLVADDGLSERRSRIYTLNHVELLFALPAGGSAAARGRLEHRPCWIQNCAKRAADRRRG